jgi:hypothetical protein
MPSTIGAHDLLGTALAAEWLVGANAVCCALVPGFEEPSRRCSISGQYGAVRPPCYRRWSMATRIGLTTIDDPIDGQVWDSVVSIILASNRSDLPAHDDGFLRLHKELTADRQLRAQLYIPYMLGHQLWKITGPEIDVQLIRAIADQVLPRANILVKGSGPIYEEILRGALGKRRDDDTSKDLSSRSWPVQL